MLTPLIHVVDDDEPVRQMLRFVLERDGLSVSEAGDVEQAKDSIRSTPPNLILLDWMLPGGSGIAFARDLKSDPVTQEIPIIMLTAKGGEDDKVRGLQSGVDDYVTKPFSARELLARIHIVLRRSNPFMNEERVETGLLSLDPASHRVHANDELVDLSPTEFRLLHFFMTHPERVYNRNQLLDLVWGTNVYIEERTVDVHVRRLRKSLENSGSHVYLQTVRGAGYRFSHRNG